MEQCRGSDAAARNSGRDRGGCEKNSLRHPDTAGKKKQLLILEESWETHVKESVFSVIHDEGLQHEVENGLIG